MLSTIDKQAILRMTSKSTRIDGRKPDEYRHIELEKGVIGTAEGSAMVKLGDTHVVAGVKIGKGLPYPDSPDRGVLAVNCELVPLANPRFEPGPPREESIELARVVDRGIRESKAIDLEKLCITPRNDEENEEGEVLVVFVDFSILDYDGNFIDAAGLAAIAALWDAKMPGTEKKLPVAQKPIPVTVAKISGNLFLDPMENEENVMDCRLTATTNDAGDICAMQKGISGSLSEEEVLKIVELSRKKGAELRKMV